VVSAGRDLVYAKAGCLYRRPFRKRGAGAAKQIANFNPNRFEAIPAPAWALRL